MPSIFSLTLRTMPIDVTYAIRSGVGLALISIVDWVACLQRLDTASLTGIGLTVSGVLLIHLFVYSVPHRSRIPERSAR